MTKKIIDFWPFPNISPRQSQITTFDWLETVHDKKYKILEMPVGGGKSFIAITYARYLAERDKKSSYILTPQKILQKQYAADFDKYQAKALYGKGTYACKAKNTTCDVGSVVAKPRCENCPHKKAKESAVSAQHAILNYTLALTAFAYTTSFVERSLIVADECHTLEQHLVNFDALQITYARCKKYGVEFKVHKDIQEAIKWVKEYYIPKMQPILDKLEVVSEGIKEQSNHTRNELNTMREFDSLTEHLEESIMMSVRTPKYLNHNYVLVWDKSMFQFKRLTGGYSFNNILAPQADNFLFMSSTILNKDGFCADLQIPIEETSFLSLGSEFDIENRPTYYMPRMKMNYGWNKPENTKACKSLVKDIEVLLKNHEGENGIIHTANFQVAEWLVSELKNGPHTIYHHNPGSDDSRDVVIESFLSSNGPSLLISPSSTEGLDLKDDLGRFVIFAKTPYPYMGDQWIKKRMEISPEWYQRQTLINIIQGGGRVVRSETDSGVVYIVDASFGYLYKSAHHMIPRWWKDAYQVV